MNQFTLRIHSSDSPHLYYRPVVRLPQQLDDSRDTVVEAHSILGQLCILVSGGEVTQGTDRRLSNVLLLPGPKHSMDQCFHTATLSHQSLKDNRQKRIESAGMQ